MYMVYHWGRIVMMYYHRGGFVMMYYHWGGVMMPYNNRLFRCMSSMINNFIISCSVIVHIYSILSFSLTSVVLSKNLRRHKHSAYKNCNNHQLFHNTHFLNLLVNKMSVIFLSAANLLREKSPCNGKFLIARGFLLKCLYNPLYRLIFSKLNRTQNIHFVYSRAANKKSIHRKSLSKHCSHPAYHTL